MRINVVGRHVEITEAIRQHAEHKSAKLSKYDDVVLELDYTVGQESPAKDLFWAELLVSVRNHPEIVAKSEGHDIYVLVDEVIAKAGRQLHDFKEKVKLEKR